MSGPHGLDINTGRPLDVDLGEKPEADIVTDGQLPVYRGENAKKKSGRGEIKLTPEDLAALVQALRTPPDMGDMGGQGGGMGM
jgi:hypothetical protein